ncbi:hypothetical protein BUALT_Bualt07G0015200 [Buddleja alternifolia]|uniref:Uncharacterized protein n=1 Tax=Buddleja alternifolia TaxID=168488 RepID=A0AAV6X7C0_9LAMI|nr:hypothetical protein BUALT_Bualt07G0015200 [Buddleja alternifolia]
MEGINVMSLRASSSATAAATHRLSFQQSLNPIPQKSTFFMRNSKTHMPNHSLLKQLAVPSIKSQQFDVKDGSTTAPETKIPEEDVLKVKEWKLGCFKMK